MSIYILKIVGLTIVVGVMAFAGVLYRNVSKLEKEIKAENRGSKEK
ncbi:MAG TPA: hypothetical protein HPP58_00085 [Deltaproteobacteria bacterium]|nr:hypothetical protein [Deltaproteobacteria bacterium]HIJ39640.1 hypothetical protein [Deltaproteobacteria bacterium]